MKLRFPIGSRGLLLAVGLGGATRGAMVAGQTKSNSAMNP
jgi:hypothetical protein